MKVLKFIGEVYLYAIATVVLVAIFVIQETNMENKYHAGISAKDWIKFSEYLYNCRDLAQEVGNKEEEKAYDIVMANMDLMLATVNELGEWKEKGE